MKNKTALLKRTILRYERAAIDVKYRKYLSKKMLLDHYPDDGLIVHYEAHAKTLKNLLTAMQYVSTV